MSDKGAFLIAATKPLISPGMGRVSSKTKARFVASSFTDFRKKLLKLSFGLRLEIILCRSARLICGAKSSLASAFLRSLRPRAYTAPPSIPD
jgi:hypothetical protein